MYMFLVKRNINMIFGHSTSVVVVGSGRCTRKSETTRGDKQTLALLSMVMGLQGESRWTVRLEVVGTLGL